MFRGNLDGFIILLFVLFIGEPDLYDLAQRYFEVQIGELDRAAEIIGLD